MSTTIEATFRTEDGRTRTFKAVNLIGFWWSWQGVYPSAEALATRWADLMNWTAPADYDNTKITLSAEGYRDLHLALAEDGELMMDSKEILAELFREENRER